MLVVPDEQVVVHQFQVLQARGVLQASHPQLSYTPHLTLCTTLAAASGSSALCLIASLLGLL